ncbi:class I SAM-dependent methyltransferase [Micromonospora sp. NBC_01655]|uniref:class I SAM-dependent methyltransferase n=1 Tax=Micromonospora sp. NBC_01655 TaxID=2975983 RepID=UPI0022522875|nr:class I SAM-dependent methyltransferase [Micromonospora sp. NBC_01655]MCX4472374.1 class I SAM-dependent methyltransferase [Micromonospora sp. NBC_01655]
MKADHYDSFAERYSVDNESNLINGYYERPAMIGLAGDVNGRRILDAGCGSGPLSAALRERGAIVTGFDSSPAMVELAERRLGKDATLLVADLSEPLPFADGAFDDVVVSLVLHYLRDWTAPLAELRRVLRPGGRLLLSVNHPIVYEAVHPDSDYFALARWSDEHTFDGHSTELTYWHRPLHAMTDAFTDAGFRLSVISEPPSLPRLRASSCLHTSGTARRSSASSSSSSKRTEPGARLPPPALRMCTGRLSSAASSVRPAASSHAV